MRDQESTSALYQVIFFFCDVIHNTLQEAITACVLDAYAPERFWKAVAVQRNQSLISVPKKLKSIEESKGKRIKINTKETKFLRF
jgi:hypothetical protein